MGDVRAYTAVRRIRLGLLTGLTVVTTLIMGPASVYAATLTFDGQALRFAGASGEVNQFRVLHGDSFTQVNDDAASITTFPPGCVQQAAGQIFCPAAVSVTVDLGDGNDFALGDEGDDVLSGGDGNDVLEGREGRDAVDGGSGDDVINPGRIAAEFTVDNGDTVAGGSGTDLVRYARPSDTLQVSLDDQPNDGTAGRGTTSGVDVENRPHTGSNDTVTGDGDANRIDAGGGNDVVRGGGGNDVLIGLTGDDQLFGEDGDDTLAANTGHNVLDGGPGLDQFETSDLSCGIFDCSVAVNEYRARDGIRETIDCFGVSGSKAIVDRLDVTTNCRSSTEKAHWPIRPSRPPASASLARSESAV